MLARRGGPAAPAGAARPAPRAAAARRSAAAPRRAAASSSRSPRSTPSSTSRPIASSARFFAGVARDAAPGRLVRVRHVRARRAVPRRARTRRRSRRRAAGRGRGSSTPRPAVPTEYSESYRLARTAADDDLPLPRCRPRANGARPPIAASSSPTACSIPPRSRALAGAAPASTVIATWGGFDWRPLDADRPNNTCSSCVVERRTTRAENRLRNTKK